MNKQFKHFSHDTVANNNIFISDQNETRVSLKIVGKLTLDCCWDVKRYGELFEEMIIWT